MNIGNTIIYMVKFVQNLKKKYKPKKEVLYVVQK